MQEKLPNIFGPPVKTCVNQADYFLDKKQEQPHSNSISLNRLLQHFKFQVLYKQVYKSLFPELLHLPTSGYTIVAEKPCFAEKPYAIENGVSQAEAFRIYAKQDTPWHSLNKFISALGFHCFSRR